MVLPSGSVINREQEAWFISLPFIKCLRKVCYDHDHQDALVYHPSQSFIGFFINNHAFSGIRLVLREELSDFSIDSCGRSYIVGNGVSY